MNTLSNNTDTDKKKTNTCADGTSATADVMSNSIEIPADTGMAIRSVLEALRAKHKFEQCYGHIVMSVSVQFIEIYDEKILDLLSATYLAIRRDNGELVGVSEVEITDIRQAIDVIVKGHERKKFAATSMNERSSRSHTALILKVSVMLRCVIIYIVYFFCN